MPATFEIIPEPIGSQFVQSIGSNDPDDLNDFPVHIIADENVVLEQSKLSVSGGSSIVSFEGEGCAYKAIVRPPTTAGTVTITIAANAVSQGNSQTSKNIRVSRSFPDADAESANQLIGVNYFGVNGIAVSPTRIYVNREQGAARRLYVFAHDGTEQTSEELNLSHGHSSNTLNYFNGSLLAGAYRFSPITDARLVQYPLGGAGIVHTRLGLLQFTGTNPFKVLPYDYEDANSIYEIDAALSGSNISTSGNRAAHQNDLLYLFVNYTSTGGFMGVARITADNKIEFVKQLNIDTALGQAGRVRDIAIYRDTLYILRAPSTPQMTVHSLDIRKYRPLDINTKTRIDVQFMVFEGQTLDLTPFCPDAERIIFDTNFDKPSYLSINASNKLEVAANAVTETTAVLVKLKGINRIDATPTGSFQFYLVIQRTVTPKWRPVDALTMRANSTYDMFQLIDADRITFRSNRTRLTDSSISNGVFRIGTTGGRAYFTATKGRFTSHFEVDIVVVQESGPENFSDVFQHRVEIAGIDVSADVSVFPSVSETLDAVILNEYRPNEVTLTLKSNNTNGHKYNTDVPNNFWETHNLNPGGYQEPIKIFIESLVNGRYVSHLLFSGTILKPIALINEAGVQLTCLDLTRSLQNTQVQDFGTLEKYDRLRQQSDEVSFQGEYMPEGSLLPMQIGTGEAWNDQRKMTIRELALPSEGAPLSNTGYLTPSQFLTSGGYLDANPLLKFKTQHRAEDIRFLVNQLALNKRVYNAEIDLPAVELDNPFILNRGSVSFSVEKTRNTRLLRDWVYDSTNDRILMLLSNPEGHIADQLVQYSVTSDFYRVLYTFTRDIKVHRIERRNTSNYYLLTSKPISQDRSASVLPRAVDSTSFAYDSAAEGSEIKIYHYNTSTGTLTEHVAANNAYPPQLGVHYWVGFENSLYIDDFEGIVADNRSAFKSVVSNLYYRYTKDGEFGVARVDVSGNTTRLIHETNIAQWNHLNFAFDVTSGGVVYFVYSVRDNNSTSLVIKRRASDGTVTTLLTEKRNIGDFLTEDTVDFGGFLGCYEALFHNNFLYVLCPIQKIEDTENRKSPVATPVGAVINDGTGQGRLNSTVTITNSPLGLGEDIVVRFNVRNARTSGSSLNFDVNQSEFTITNGTLVSTTRFSSSITLTIRPSNANLHQNIGIGVRLIWAGNPTLDNGYILIDFGIALSRSKSAGMALYRCNVTANSPSLTLIEKWDFVQRGGCNLVVHEGSVHYVESPPAIEIFKPVNPDLDGYWSDEAETQTMGYNIVPEALGALKKINSAGAVESLGNLQYTDRPYNISATRCLSFDDELHLAMGYGNLDEILRFNSLASKPDNVQHLVFGNKLRYVLPKFEPNGSRYALLADIAKKVNATLSFHNGLITIRDRNPYRAQTDGATGTGTGDLDFDNQNKIFPSSGYLMIDKEIIGYTGISSSAFTGVTRGVLQTSIINHANNTPILFLNAVLPADRILGNFSIVTDTTRIFNVITNSENTAAERDPDSIDAYDERPYTLDLGLTNHQLAWQEHIFPNYLENLKAPRQLINLTLRPTNYLEAGQIIGFKYDLLVYAMQLVSVTKSKESTQIRGRTL